MEVNNYQSFILYLNKIEKYKDLPVLLFYRQKRQDLKEEDFTGFTKLVLVSNVNNIDIELVKMVCKSNMCRCYISVLDKLLLKSIGKLTLTSERITEFFDSEILEQKGLHLIDIDDPSIDVDSLANYIEEKGGKYIGIFPSRSGMSLIFYGSSEIIKNYNETLEKTDPNRGHMICGLNLYIPNYYGS